MTQAVNMTATNATPASLVELHQAILDRQTREGCTLDRALALLVVAGLNSHANASLEQQIIEGVACCVLAAAIITEPQTLQLVVIDLAVIEMGSRISQAGARLRVGPYRRLTDDELSEHVDRAAMMAVQLMSIRKRLITAASDGAR